MPPPPSLILSNILERLKHKCVPRTGRIENMKYPTHSTMPNGGPTLCSPEKLHYILVFSSLSPYYLASSKNGISNKSFNPMSSFSVHGVSLKLKHEPAFQIAHTHWLIQEWNNPSYCYQTQGPGHCVNQHLLSTCCILSSVLGTVINKKKCWAWNLPSRCHLSREKRPTYTK